MALTVLVPAKHKVLHTTNILPARAKMTASNNLKKARAELFLQMVYAEHQKIKLSRSRHPNITKTFLWQASSFLL